MSQHAARRGPHATPADEDAGDQPPGQPERTAARPPSLAGGPPGGEPGEEGPGPGGPRPGGPDEGEFELAGDDDLGAADLGPAAPGFTDPDAPSGRVRR